MREILFRGKRVDNGEWVYGYYTELPEGDIGATLMVGSDELLCEDTAAYIVSIETKQCPSFSPAYPIQVFDADLCKVCPETVGQYTGLTDKNGKKIFEGDILQGYQYPYLSEGHFNYYAEVIYFENCPAFGLYTFKNPNLNIVIGISSGNTDLMEDWESENWEIIGNIYDNPELLKEDL